MTELEYAEDIRKILDGYQDEPIYIRNRYDLVQYGIEEQVLGIVRILAKRENGYYENIKKSLASYLDFIKEYDKYFRASDVLEDIWFSKIDHNGKLEEFNKVVFHENTSVLYRIFASDVSSVAAIIFAVICLASGFYNPSGIVYYVFISYACPTGFFVSGIAYHCYKHKQFAFLVATYLFLCVSLTATICILSLGDNYYITHQEITKIRFMVTTWNLSLLSLPSLYLWDDKHFRYCLHKGDLTEYKNIF